MGGKRRLASHLWWLLGIGASFAVMMVYFIIRLVGDPAISSRLGPVTLGVAYVLMATGLVLVVAYLCWGLRLYSQLLVPAERLVDAAWRLSKGDYSQEEAGGEPGAVLELAELERCLHTIRARLRLSLEESNEASKANRHGFTAMLGALNDAIASNKAAQAAAAHAEDQRLQFEQLVNSVADYAIIRLGPDGRIATWNQGAERLDGYSAGEILGQEFSSFFLPEDIAAGKPAELLERARETGRAEDQGWRLRRNGTRYWADVILTPIRDDLGGLLGFSRVTRDLTEQKRSEEQRRQLDHLKQVDQLKNQFLSILSHELRTPINAIMGFGSILDDEVAGPMTAEQHRYLRKMLAGAETLLALVNDLLDMSRIQAGKFRLHPDLMNFQDVAERVLGNLQPLAERKRLELSSAIPPGLPELVADPQRIGQVLVNLVGNAIKFTPAGGRILVHATREGDRLRCEVEDTGIGISPEHLPKLFAPFTQVDSSNTRQAGGAGLGLSISKALIEAHGGAIGVRSEVAHGSCFWFTLPLTAWAQGDSGVSRRVEAEPTSQERQGT